MLCHFRLAFLAMHTIFSAGHTMFKLQCFTPFSRYIFCTHHLLFFYFRQLIRESTCSVAFWMGWTEGGMPWWCRIRISNHIRLRRDGRLRWKWSFAFCVRGFEMWANENLFTQNFSHQSLNTFHTDVCLLKFAVRVETRIVEEIITIGADSRLKGL